MERRIDNGLLKRFIAGLCTPEEKELVNQYLQQQVGRRHLEELLRDTWDASDEHRISGGSHESWRHELWSRLTGNEEVPSMRESVKRFGRKAFFRYAAIWALLALIGAGVYLLLWAPQDQPLAGIPQIEKANPYGRRSLFDLGDGTRVYLGAGSKIRFPRAFNGSRREVELEGEAFFEVVRDTKKPFIIHTGEIRTEVLGTSFMVKAFDDGEVEVAVATGKVRVDRYANGKRVQQLGVLTAGQQVIYQDALRSAETSEIPVANLMQWKAGKMVFSGTPFGDMLEEIGRNYNLKFVLEKKQLKHIPITLTLDSHAPFDELLNSLSIYIGFSYEIQGNQIIIK